MRCWLSRLPRAQAKLQVTDKLLELPSAPDEAAAAAPAASELQTVYVPAAAASNTATAVPVPMHSEFSEDRNGLIVLAPARSAPRRGCGDMRRGGRG